jgi:hypothetical protein
MPSSRVLQSSPFKFFVDKDKTCFTVHRSLAKGLSDPLHTMMNNEHYKEARDGKANLEGVEVSSFVGFCEFAYTGNYRTRMKDYKPDSESYAKAIAEKGRPLEEIRPGEEAEPGEAEDDLDGIAPHDEDLYYAEDDVGEDEEITSATAGWQWYRDRKNRTKEEIPTPKSYKQPGPTITKVEQLWNDFQTLSFEPNRSISNQSGDMISGNGSIAGTPSLLHHAKIYVFAQEYLIHNLCALSLSKLHADLCP